MDSREQRAAHARWISSVLCELVDDGGDELAVIAEDVAGWLKGRRAYGALDLDKPHDWERELADEERDSRNYIAAMRLIRKRDAVRRLDESVPFAPGYRVVHPLPEPEPVVEIEAEEPDSIPAVFERLQVRRYE